MSKREENQSENSVVSVTDSLKSLMASGIRYAGELSGLTFLDETFLQEYGPEQFLRRMLSTKSYISSSSSLANKNQDAFETPDLRAFTQVGKGQCGTVWALTGTTTTLKITNEGKEEQLYNDFCKHAAVEDAFQQTLMQFRRNINLPRLADWIGSRNEMFWKSNAKLFPEGMQPTSGILSSRIFPVPIPVRSSIVDSFAPRDVRKNKENFLSQPENKDCLIRLYLGRRQSRSASSGFRLRNFGLTVNEMEYLRLDTELLASTMAQTLAIIHWKAKIDANDVEFVFGSAPAVKMRATTAEYNALNWRDVERLSGNIDFQHRSIGIWVLDFDQCQNFPEDVNGVKQLERGFYFNDPYYPRPISDHPKDKALWQIFKERYLETSAALTSSEMPKQFVAAVEAEGKKRASGSSLFQ